MLPSLGEKARKADEGQGMVLGIGCGIREVARVSAIERQLKRYFEPMKVEIAKSRVNYHPKYPPTS